MTAAVQDYVLKFVGDRGGVQVSDIDRGTSLDDLGFDSLVLLELAMKLRREFHVVTSDDDLVFVETVGELLDIIHRTASVEPPPAADEP